MNKAVLMGRLTGDPKLKTTQSGTAVVSVRIAVNRRFAKADDAVKADFFDVVCWRGTAEFVARYFKKGQMIAVIGSLQVRSWQDKDGGKRYVTEVVADEVYFADSKKERGGEAAESPDFMEVRDDEPLPF